MTSVTRPAHQEALKMEASADPPYFCSDLPATSPCIPCTRSGKLPVVVRKLSGESIEFEMTWDESIAELKVRLTKIISVTPCYQVLLCGACEMKSHCQLKSYVYEVPLVVTLVVRMECPPEVAKNTEKLLTAFRDGMAPRPCGGPNTLVGHRRVTRAPVKSLSASPGAPAHEQAVQVCIHAQARKLVPGRTPAARKLRELRRKALQSEATKAAARLARPTRGYIWRRRGYQYHFLRSLEQPSWAGLEADMEHAIRHHEVDLEGYQVLKHAFREGCGEMALLCLRHGADPSAVSLHEAVAYFRGRGRLRSSDPLVPAPETVFKNPADGFALVRAICHLRQCQAVMSNAPVDPLAAARATLARVATELALLQPFGGESITKQAVAHAAGIPQLELDAYGEDLWAGWPMAFLSFSEPRAGPCTRLDNDFMRVRACLVASSISSSICQSQGETVHLYDWRHVPWEEPEPDLESLDKEYDLWKCRNRKWTDSNTTKRRVTRVPWATAKGASTSRSSRLARRLPKSTSHIWARGYCHRKNHTLDWDGENHTLDWDDELLEPTEEYCMPTAS
eukprot:gnl/MRDRNA2_/MRDRNA2_103341_c0_seq1.p1 gnl/MRDRNA2_/MRDRNA2_103341_c0~~gnl/MRDRNA2_/MRDRNA2_103341_c0_seq1.p1  ORF type:complete len:565 (-),score=66.17 gnl/MRDRNA2_/MRDRNA2_103341_c0_seq1:162-1856(-)